MVTKLLLKKWLPPLSFGPILDTSKARTVRFQEFWPLCVSRDIFKRVLTWYHRKFYPTTHNYTTLPVLIKKKKTLPSDDALEKKIHQHPSPNDWLHPTAASRLAHTSAVWWVSHKKEESLRRFLPKKEEFLRRRRRHIEEGQLPDDILNFFLAREAWMRRGTIKDEEEARSQKKARVGFLVVLVCAN